MEKEYQFLCEFTNNTHPTENHLVKRYGKMAVTEAVEQGWIIEFGKNKANEILYAITQRGKDRRDK